MTMLRVLEPDTIGRETPVLMPKSIVDFVLTQMRSLRDAWVLDPDAGAARHRCERAEYVFRNVRYVSTDRIPFPPIARIILNMRCHYACGVENLCHREGLPSEVASGTLSLTDLRKLGYVREALRLQVAKLIGVETTPLPVFCGFVREVKTLGFNTVTTTCAIGVAQRSMESLAAAGIDRITCSVHQFNNETERSLDGLIVEADRYRLPVKLNWVLTWQNVAELRAFIEYLGQKKLTARLFSPILKSGVATGTERKPLHWTDLSDLFSHDIAGVSVVDYTLSCRRKYLVALHSGATLDLSVPLVAAQDPGVIPQVCASCRLKDHCEEGLLGCGVRLGPDGSYYACLLRPDLRAL